MAPGRTPNSQFLDYEHYDRMMVDADHLQRPSAEH